jgi:site-specific DNA recombinase
MIVMEDRKTIRTAIYGRVSSEQQAKSHTIASQLAALKERVQADGLNLEDELCFVDEGHSGGTLLRPALERLRDVAYAGGIDRLYVHSPDRLARRYAYQVLLVDELKRCGVEIVFLNHRLGTTPEEDLLLQVQGMIAEYERAKILERSRRGKRHAARRGSVSVLSGAPYGYRYIAKDEGGGGEAHYQVIFEEARVVKQIFEWVARDGLSINEVCRRLEQQQILTRTGKTCWDRTTVWGMLKNPAYKGLAAFGKTRAGERRPQLRPLRNRSGRGRRSGSTYDTLPEEQESIPVPAIVAEDLFAAAGEQLAVNRKHSRQRKRGARYLLQGLVACKCCGYAYYGKPVGRAAAKGKQRHYAYYRCIGTDAYRFGGERICTNTQVRTDLLDAAVWEDICTLLNHPERMAQEYQRRLNHPHRSAAGETRQLAEMIQKGKRGLARLIDAYEDGLLSKSEFEPRIRIAKQRLAKLEGEADAMKEQELQEQELRLVIGQFEEFAKRVQEGLHEPDWLTRREIIRSLVKRIEIDQENVRVIYKVNPSPFAVGPDRGRLQDCWRRDLSLIGEHLPALVRGPVQPSRRTRQLGQRQNRALCGRFCGDGPPLGKPHCPLDRNDPARPIPADD